MPNANQDIVLSEKIQELLRKSSLPSTKHDLGRVIAADPGWRMIIRYEPDDRGVTQLTVKPIVAWVCDPYGSLEPAFADTLGRCTLIMGRGIGRVIGIVPPGTSRPLEEAEHIAVDLDKPKLRAASAG